MSPRSAPRVRAFASPAFSEAGFPLHSGQPAPTQSCVGCRVSRRRHAQCRCLLRNRAQRSRADRTAALVQLHGIAASLVESYGCPDQPDHALLPDDESCFHRAGENRQAVVQPERRRHESVQSALQRVGVHLERRLLCRVVSRFCGSERLYKRLSWRAAVGIRNNHLSVLIPTDIFANCGDKLIGCLPGGVPA